MPSGLGPYFDMSDLGMEIAIDRAKRDEIDRRNEIEREFNSALERARNGTATPEELRRHGIHPLSEREARNNRSLPRGGVYFPRVSEEVARKYQSVWEE